MPSPPARPRPRRHSREGGNPVSPRARAPDVIPAKAGIQFPRAPAPPMSFPRRRESSLPARPRPRCHSREGGNPVSPRARAPMACRLAGILHTRPHPLASSRLTLACHPRLTAETDCPSSAAAIARESPRDPSYPPSAHPPAPAPAPSPTTRTPPASRASIARAASVKNPPAAC
jgi:hypothetical protein